MALATCTFCGCTTDNSADGICHECGATMPPLASSSIPLAKPVLMGGSAPPDLRVVARMQRWLLWLVLSIMAFYLLFTIAGPAFMFRGAGPNLAYIVVMEVVLLGLYVASVVVVILLLNAMRSHIATKIVCGILVFAPCVNLIMLVLVNRKATAILKTAGIPVGFMGASDRAVVLKTDPTICRHCGYSLIGNLSGRCPECGDPARPRDG